MVESNINSPIDLLVDLLWNYRQSLEKDNEHEHEYKINRRCNRKKNINTMDKECFKNKLFDDLKGNSDFGDIIDILCKQIPLRNGSIIPYASGIAVTAFSVAGIAESGSLIGFGNAVTDIGVLDGVVDLTGTLFDGELLNFAFSIPKNGSIESIAATFSISEAISLSRSTTLHVQLFSAPAGSNIFSALPAADLSMTITGPRAIGDTVSGFLDIIPNIHVVAGTRLLLVMYITGETLSIPNVEGYLSAGVKIV